MKCAKCHRPGFRYRGKRWLCVIHNRIDTMQNTARAKGKFVPSVEVLELMLATLEAGGMTCHHCARPVVFSNAGNRLSVISLQHDRSGKVRLLCMLCNQRHDDCPGDEFYTIPTDSKRCPRCRTIKSISEFYAKANGMPFSYCKPCCRSIAIAKHAANMERRSQ